VNPFGDRRGGAFNSVWTFDLNNGMLFLSKNGAVYSTPLSLARAGLLTPQGFERLQEIPPTPCSGENPPGPYYWEPDLCPCPRKRAFVGRLLRDFGHTWRHVLRQPMRAGTFIKLAYATMWILMMDFTIIERTGFDHISVGGPYVRLVDLPGWDTPKATLFQTESCRIALGQDITEGIELVRRHLNDAQNVENRDSAVYIILTLRQVVLCKTKGRHMHCTRSATLFNDPIPASDAAIDMLIWATNLAAAEPQPTTLGVLPIEIQDRILYCATASSVASAKLGCELGLGSPFSWVECSVMVGLEVFKRNRSETSPVESQIALNGTMSGLSYKRQRGYQAHHVGKP
jgi:hypothetical protein